MKQPAGQDRPEHPCRPTDASPSRRKFLKVSAAAAAYAAIGPPFDAVRNVASGSQLHAAANHYPGRIVLYHDPAMNGHGTIDMLRTEEVVHHAVQILTQRADAGRAFKTLLPGVRTDSKVAIKVNNIGPTDTRWEIVRGIVSGLSLMPLGEDIYDVSNVTIFDRDDNLDYHGYLEANFTFNGNTVVFADGNHCDSGYDPVQGRELSRFIFNADFVINVPALKSHNDPYNHLTLALKNHYGSCNPSNLCGDIPGMLTLNADPHIAGKTVLVVTSGLRGTYTGGPSGPPGYWLTFPEATPNTIFFTTDPVTNEYWARDMINAERGEHGWGDKVCPWIEQASNPSWNLGISDPDLMTVFRLDATDAEEPEALVGGTFLAANVPNPFRDQTSLRFRLERSGAASMRIYDASGRVVRDLGSREFAQGYHEIPWDGRDTNGRKLSAGVYFARLSAASLVRTRRIVLAY
jgi:hypothetical protein